MATEFLYKNHRGEISKRRVEIRALDFQFFFTFGYQPGWFLHCWDLDKLEVRSFALSNIILDPEGPDIGSFFWRGSGRVKTARLSLEPPK